LPAFSFGPPVHHAPGVLRFGQSANRENTTQRPACRRQLSRVPPSRHSDGLRVSSAGARASAVRG